MTISTHEREHGQLTAESLTQALGLLRETGYVTIERVLPEDWVTKMRTACDRALRRRLSSRKQQKVYLEERGGHVSFFPPVKMPYMDPLAIEHPISLQIMEAAMGRDIFCTFYNTNTTWPGSGVQRIHRDFAHLFRELPYALPVSVVVVNIPLVDFTEENGCTEVWPGSHLITDHGIDPAMPIEERVVGLQSVRTVMPAGSLVVRDMRMWHRGMPNKTDTIRTMLAIVYFREFFQRNETMTVPKATWEGMSERAQKLFRHNRVK